MTNIIFRGLTRVLKLGGGSFSCPTKGVAARSKGCGSKVAKGVVKVVHKMLGNFEVIVQIRVGGLPPISKHRKEW